MHPKYAYMDGDIVEWDKARVHVFSPAVRYATAVFECIPCVHGTDGIKIFRLDDHLKRLEYSCKMMRFSDVEYDLRQGIFDVIERNNFTQDILVRPMVYLGGESPGGSIGSKGKSSLAITAYPKPIPKYQKHGCHIQVSSWRRISDEAMPARIKATANYQNGRMAELQSHHDGYDGSLLLNQRGNVSEGPGQCFMMVRDGMLITPDVNSDILESITRDTILELARNQGIQTEERTVDRSELHMADEALFCGSTSGIVPITGIDGIKVGDGKIGSLTHDISKMYHDALRVDSGRGWITKFHD